MKVYKTMLDFSQEIQFLMVITYENVISTLILNAE